MWLLVFAMFLGCKWLTLQRAKKQSTVGPSIAYLFAWPGMDAKAFLDGAPVEHPGSGEWWMAAAEILIGGILLWLAATRLLALGPLITGWMAMTGIVMILHFGLFQMLSIGWRAAGRNAQPLMRAPLLATSLADFWGTRWNTAFTSLANELALRKLARGVGVAWATLAIFLGSGVIHDVVISLPAQAGYGLPTGYFALQGLAVLFERSRPGRALGLGRGWRGRAFSLIIIAAPAFWLFHPPFVNNVILPMLRAIGNLL